MRPMADKARSVALTWIPSPRRQRHPAASATFGHNFRKDRERDFFWRNGADIQTDWRAHFLQLYFVSAFFPQLIQHNVCSALAADHPDVVRL